MLKNGIARGAVWTVVVVAAFFAADFLLFRTGWYDYDLKPLSSAGDFETRLHWLELTPPSKVPEVLVVGDSRIGEGFSTRVAGITVDRHIHFWNFGMPGTMPRVWYYALRAGDPTRRRFAAIAIAMDKYSDADWFGSAEDRVLDQNFLVMQLGLGDCLPFASSVHTMGLRERALFGCLFRGMILRPDVQEFAANPRARLERADDRLKNGLRQLTNYSGKPESLTGLTADWTNRTIQFPDGVSEATRDNVRKVNMPDGVPEAGALTGYRQRWLGGILDMYKDSPTRFIFFRLPRGPIVDPQNHDGPGFVDSAAKRPRVTVLPADTFDELERPELFADGLHLNHDGRPIFSERLAKDIESILSPTEPRPQGSGN